MSHHRGDDAEYMADEYEMEDVEDDMDDESLNRERVGTESDVDDYDYSVCNFLFLIFRILISSVAISNCFDLSFLLLSCMMKQISTVY